MFQDFIKKPLGFALFLAVATTLINVAIMPLQATVYVNLALLLVIKLGLITAYTYFIYRAPFSSHFKWVAAAWRWLFFVVTSLALFALVGSQPIEPGIPFGVSLGAATAFGALIITPLIIGGYYLLFTIGNKIGLWLLRKS